MNHGELLLIAAIPVFVASMLVEVALMRWRPAAFEDEIGYGLVDSRTNITMGLGNLALSALWVVVPLAAWAGLYELTPLRLGQHGWPSWVLLVVLEDLCYYAFHRTHHEVRLFWAAHVTHHSSQTYNFSTALRQEWLVPLSLPFWLPLALLGFTPAQIALQQAVSLIYQFFLHTERVRTLGPLEWVLNTPSHHRVHHGSNQAYLDKNYGGILIVWDRLFGTLEPERERVRYGITKNLTTHNPLVVGLGELRSLVSDVRQAGQWRARLGYVLRRPGWSPGA